MTVSSNPLILVAAIILLGLFWPLAQRLRHKDLKPLAAYLLFTSVFVLVGSAVFVLIFWINLAVLPEGALRSPVAMTFVLLIAAVPAFVAGFLVVRRPQIRRMPR